MVLSGIYVIPHGDELLDNPSDGSVRLRRQIENIASGDSSGSLVIISPHGLRLRKKVSVINTERLRSGYSTLKHVLDSSFMTDRKLAELIASGLEYYTEEVQFVTSSGDLSVFPVDFGTAIPLSFFEGRRVVSMGQPRTSDLEFLVDFGRKLVPVLENHDLRTSVIISADQAHTHWEGGPYGYSDKAAEYDRMIIDALNRSEFAELHELSGEYIDAAKPDSYWNMLILSGMLEASGRKLRVLDYYVEKYFGMLVAAES